MTFKEMWSEQPPLECKNDLLKDNIHILKWCYERGQQDVMDSQKKLQEENERLEKESINLKDTIHFLELHTKQYKKERQELIEAHEKDRELLLKHIDKYKEDLKKLRVAFIQVQVEHLLGKPITEIVETISGVE